MTLAITTNLFDELSNEMEQDLTALFNSMQDDVLLLQEKAQRENWTPEELLEAVDILFE